MDGIVRTLLEAPGNQPAETETAVVEESQDTAPFFGFIGSAAALVFACKGRAFLFFSRRKRLIRCALLFLGRPIQGGWLFAAASVPF